MQLRFSVGALALVALLSTVQAFAGEGNGGGERRFDPEAMRQRMLERITENLGLSADEATALKPKIEAVQKAQANARGGGGFGGGMGGRRRGGQGGAGGEGAPPAPAAPPQSDTQKKSEELRTLADNKESDAAAVKTKLTEYREARDKARADVKKAQDELKELLTPRQEAQLVLMGILE